MAKSSVIPHSGLEKSALALVHLVGIGAAVTISLYTSRRGRVWVSCKTWGEPTYSSSVELDTDGDVQKLVQGICTCTLMHEAKMSKAVERVDTWLNIDQAVSVWESVEKQIPIVLAKYAEPDPVISPNGTDRH